MIKLFADNKDTIVYTCGNAINSTAKEAKKNADLSSFYSGNHDSNTPVPVAINASQILKKIKAKLTPMELYVLKNKVR
jgi:hypothetical protein